MILFIFKVFIKIHKKYANKKMYISEHRKKDTCLSDMLTPILVTLDMI